MQVILLADDSKGSTTREVALLVLSKQAWTHIRARHPEVSEYRRMIEEVLENPDLIVRGRRSGRKAVRYVRETHLGPKHLVVVYREEGQRKVILTAYFTSDLKRVKGEPIWRA